MYIYGLVPIYPMYKINNQISKKGLEETITRIMGFVDQVEYYEGSELVYVRKAGGLDIVGLEKLERVGLKLRYLNPIVFNSKYGTERKGLQISLEIMGVKK